nr:uncharacterized protein LOC109148116 [Ipomoea trifida]
MYGFSPVQLLQQQLNLKGCKIEAGMLQEVTSEQVSQFMDRGRGGTLGGGRGRQARQSRGGRVARLVQGTRDVPVDEVPPSGIPLP